MTPEEAEAWAAERALDADDRARKAALIGPTCCMEGCMVPPYLDGYCQPHWKLRIGYTGHARMRDADALREAHRIAAARGEIDALEEVWNAS